MSSDRLLRLRSGFSPRVGCALLCAVMLCSGGCGKYGPPLAPEVFSPQAVGELQSSLEGKTLVLRWRAPSDDLRSRALRSLDSYRIYRKSVERDSQVLDEEVEFEVVAEVPDRSFAELESRQKEARELGLPGHRVRLTEEFIIHEFRDDTLEEGTRYYYRVVPVNQGDVEGAAPQLVRVIVEGARSETSVIAYSELGPNVEVEDFVIED
ncbi:MAG: hypothetical protein QY326_08580 [Bdellovibrionota bacterium]|nr:MAG: hypothetical protein QY326_08580 [Bdellovibrionota bacterium]